ncbi:Dimer Tnp hAT domain-containing protein [Aphis craccivora]|uniref:Dimer Tnp hAT domain-containing protein n=1 Tax=Aphis craccivora TaxID=307492 RepID=A0A6G0VVH4_APHCR|nr:Dimer Tnp hAT domain-containing protein [Aphis craccivora]
MIHLSASKACIKLPRSIEDVLRNIGSHFSRSHSRQMKYKEFQEFFKVEIHKILSPCTTRWLSLKACVDRILEQYPALKEYFRLLHFEDPSKTLEQIYDTLNNSFTIVYLEFMSYILGILTSFNTLFQGTGSLLYLLKPEIEKLLKTVCLNFMTIGYIRNLVTIINVSPNATEYQLPINEIYIGVTATESITNLINSNEITKFYKSCQEFY